MQKSYFKITGLNSEISMEFENEAKLLFEEIQKCENKHNYSERFLDAIKGLKCLYSSTSRSTVALQRLLAKKMATTGAALIFCDKTTELLLSNHLYDLTILDLRVFSNMYWLLNALSYRAPEYNHIIANHPHLMKLVARELQMLSFSESNIISEITWKNAFVDNSLCIIHNLAVDEERIPKLRQLQLVSTVVKYLNYHKRAIKFLAVRTLTLLVNGGESKILQGNQICEYLIETFKETVESPDYKYIRYDFWDLSSITEILAKNEENRRILVEQGIFPLLVTAARSESMVDQIEAVKALYTLSLDKENQRKMASESCSSVMELILSNRNSPIENVKVTSFKILWLLREELAKVEKYANLEAVKALYTLSLDKENQRKMASESCSSVMELILSNRNSPIENVKVTSFKILWLLREELAKVEKYANLAKELKDGYIKLRYQSGNRNLLKIISDRLQDTSLATWMEHGNKRESIHHASGHTDVIVIWNPDEYEKITNLKLAAHTNTSGQEMPNENMADTIDSEQVYAKVESDQDTGLLSDKGLHFVAKRLGSDWYSVAIDLGLPLQTIQLMEQDYPRETLMKITNLLEIWKNQEELDEQRKIKQLLDVLEVNERHDLIHELRGKFGV